MVLARDLTKPQMGTWALFLIVVNTFEIAKTSLLKNAHIRYVTSSGDPLEKSVIASSSFIINSVLSLVFILFIIFFSDNLSSWLHAGTELSTMLKWFIPAVIFMIFFSHLEAIQQSHLDFKGVFAGYFIRQFLFFAVIIIYAVFKIPFSIIDLVLYQVATILFGTIILYIYSRRFMVHKFNPTIPWIKKIIGYGGYIFGSGVASTIFSNVDPLMTAAFLTNTAVAYYSIPSRINGIIDIPSFVAADILFPKSTRALVEEGESKVKYLFERMVAVLLFFITPVSLFIILLPHFVIRIIAGPGYEIAALILQLYMIAGIFRPMQNQAANILNSIGKSRLCFIMNIITLTANLVINYICFLNFGFYGAAIGTFITLLLSLVAWHFIMKKQIGYQLINIFKQMAKIYKDLKIHSRIFFSRTKKINRSF